MSEERYTLDEAVQELARRECRDHGHDWNLVVPEPTFAERHPVPTHIRCDRCGYSLEVVSNQR